MPSDPLERKAFQNNTRPLCWTAHLCQNLLKPLSDVDDVQEMMDDIQEQTELSDEISRAISEPAGFGMDYNEVSWIFVCLQSLLYLEMAIYHLSKLMECCANLLYSTIIIVITKLFYFFVPWGQVW